MGPERGGCSYIDARNTWKADLTKTPLQLEAKLLAGEIVVNEASFVRKCIGTDSGQDDLWGKLICTNFKISFITQDTPPCQKGQYVNRLLGEHDVPLACVDQVVTVNDTKGKRKVLGSNQKLKFSPSELIVYCKDFRIIRFRFDEAGPESAKKVCLAIAHYSQPADPQLLFGFEYVGKRHHAPGDQVNGTDHGSSLQTPLFDRSSDWDREIKRTGASEWRVCSINEGYAVSPSLSEYFVVPASLADQDLKQYSGFFMGQRLPFWCWNHVNGSALVRMANISDPAQQRKLDQRICNAITKSHPKRGDVLKSDLDKALPNIQDIQAAFLRLRQICVMEPYEESEEKWLASVESSRWLEYVRAFLKHSAEVVYMLDGQQASVILKEEQGRDLACVVASLAQLMLDPHCRGLTGFQGLLQKEWVTAGHRFLDRCNHLKKSAKEECPLFLLFLDCVWQLLSQYPAAFEFTETYLTVLGDSLWLPVFSTFLFNCPRQHTQHCRDLARSKNLPSGGDMGLCFPPVWDWSQQFSPRDQALFNSPLYVGKGAPCVQNGAVKTFRRTKKNYSSTLRGVPSLKNGMLGELQPLPRRGSLALGGQRPVPPQPREALESPSERFFGDWFSRPADLQGLLLPQLLPSHLRLWRLYFLRWVAEAQIPGGGPITAFRKVSRLADEIEGLRLQLRGNKGAPVSGLPQPEPRRMYFRADSPNDPPSTPPYLSSSFPFSPVGNLCRRSVLDTPLSKFLSGAKTWLSTETLANETL
ncbi:myotubularin-related protein 10-like isoform X2 [Conger conger]|uniref:myotubularin-related protein 10-like isoform X2 n=1 Tax=Conger conger TaxID=82655 RepID=UPI002A5A8CFE|nr:myotubularin-related protein 10-like isoform X2 [Conger conger]